MSPSPEATYERARRLANLAVWTVELQCRRVKTIEPEDDSFVMRRWQDFQFLIVALARLRRAGTLAAKVNLIKRDINAALKEFDVALPNLKLMRDVAEHIDDYAMDKGRNKDIDRKALEVFVLDESAVNWLGRDLDLNVALQASLNLFRVIKDSSKILIIKP